MYIIAEIAQAHDGSLETLKFIEEAKTVVLMLSNFKLTWQAQNLPRGILSESIFFRRILHDLIIGKEWNFRSRLILIKLVKAWH